MSHEERQDDFLEALAEAGGRSGNVSLRERLGWSEADDDALKQALIAEGMRLPRTGSPCAFNAIRRFPSISTCTAMRLSPVAEP